MPRTKTRIGTKIGIKIGTKKNSNKNTNKKTKKIIQNRISHKPKNFIFGYGSLISSESRIFTGKGYIGNSIPVEISSKLGYKRVWVCKKSKYGYKSYLALRKSICKEKSTNIRGVLCPIFKCIKNFDKREHGYKRIKLKINTKAKRKLIKGIMLKNIPDYDFNIYIYTDTRSKPPSRECPISQRYLDIVLSGCLEYGISFTKHFLKNTFNWDNKGTVFLVNDRKKNNPRKYVTRVNYQQIDKIMKESGIF